MQVDTQFGNALVTFLKNLNVDPLDWLTAAEYDLYTLFIKLKESRKINEDTFNQLANMLEQENPAHYE